MQALVLIDAVLHKIDQIHRTIHIAAGLHSGRLIQMPADVETLIGAVFLNCLIIS